MDCFICKKPAANPHHLTYKGYLDPHEKGFVIFVCPWHHKLITKTAFMKTMEFIFEDRWRQYKEYLRGEQERTLKQTEDSADEAK